MTASIWTPQKVALALMPVGAFLLLLASLNDIDLGQSLYLQFSYYLMLLMVLCWASVYANRLRSLTWESLRSWIWENWPGLTVALLVTVVAGLAVDPALRVLSDEANLVGISKNLFSSKSPTFTVSGKSYYGAYWNVDSVIDQRPPVFPFLVSFVHTALGYSYRNVFHFNLVLVPLFVLVAYRLVKSLAGETAGIVASLFVIAHPIVLISARSGGFDFATTFLSLLVLKSLSDFLHKKDADNFAIFWMNLCVLSGMRYESALFILPTVGLLLLFRLLKWDLLRPYALLYALTPAFLLPRVWLSLLRGNVPKQDPGTVTFSLENFLNNTREYFQPLLDPFGSYPAHSSVLLGLGIFGLGRWLWLRPDRPLPSAKKRKLSPETHFACIVGAWMLVQCVIVFTYVWGRAQYPSAARLVIPMDVFLSLLAAWVLARALRIWPLVAVGAAVFVVAAQLPIASTNKMMSELTETRENAALWRFFERLDKRDILVVSKRPNHFTIMNYGAMSFENASKDPYLFTALDRRLFQEIYVVQQIAISTNEPLPGYEPWSDRALQTVYEFQNEANVLTRVSRVLH